jgi:hypothetical protein
VRVADIEGDAVVVTDALKVADGDSLLENVLVMDVEAVEVGVPDIDAPVDSEAVGVAVSEADCDTDAVSEAEVVHDCETDGVLDGDRVCDLVPDGVRDRDTLEDSDALPLTEVEEDTLLDCVAVMDSESVGEALDVSERDCEREGDRGMGLDTLTDGVADAVRVVGDRVLVDDNEMVGLLDEDRDLDGVLVFDRDLLDVLVSEGVVEPDLEIDELLEIVGVILDDLLTVGVLDGVLELDLDLDGVRELERDLDGVRDDDDAACSCR